MGRPSKAAAAENALWGPSSLREYWREINRVEREAAKAKRARRKQYDVSRPRCRCEAYPWPHRPGGGFCRHPDPPIERYERKRGPRPYRKRYLGILRQIARANGPHPIRDRATIEAIMSNVLTLAKEVKRRCSKIKYRNMIITERGLRGEWQTAGPKM